jgi:tetratricopeptide (TPR) repeat protein
MRGWMVEGVIDIAGVLGHDPPLAVDLLSGLVNKSLVSVDTSLSPPRYLLLETVREFGLKQLVASGEERMARDAHLAYVRRMAASIDADIHTDRVRHRLPQLEQEDANIRSAIEYATSFEEGHPSAMAIAGSLMLYWRGRGNYYFALRNYEIALRGSERLHSPERARALLGYGVNLLFTRKPNEQVAEALVSAVQEARTFGDSWTEAFAQAYLAMCYALAGEVEQADQAEKIASALAASLDDDMLRGLTGLARGWIQLTRKDPAAAAESLRLARNLGPDPHQHHFIHTYLGLALLQLDQVEDAAEQLLKGAKPAVEYNNLRGAAGFIEASAYLLSRLGRLEAATQMLGAAMHIREQTNISLLSFWFVQHRRAIETAQQGLGRGGFESGMAVGRAMRNEDAINLSIEFLQQIATGAAAD